MDFGCRFTWSHNQWVGPVLVGWWMVPRIQDFFFGEKDVEALR